MTKNDNELFRLMVNAVKDYAIFRLDREGRIASWNEGAKRFKGYSANEVLGKHFSLFYTQADKERHHPEYELKRASEEGRYEEEGWRIRKDGSMFWANVVITKLDDENGNHIGFVKVTRDLTERRKNEEALEERVRLRTRELELALKSRDEFLSIASHELKTPMTSLRLQLQIALRKIQKGSGTAEMDKSLEVALRQVSSITNLVNDLLDISRIQTGNMDLTKSEFNLSELVDEVAHRFSEQVKLANNQLELRLDPDASGSWDAGRIEQVITNLISNAIKYAPRTKIVVTTKSFGKTVVLEVKDEGPGIEEGKLESIFNRFERGSNAQNVGGLGLGLFIVKKIVELHHGKIVAESSPGKGARFIVELPRK